MKKRFYGLFTNITAIFTTALLVQEETILILRQLFPFLALIIFLRDFSVAALTGAEKSLSQRRQCLQNDSNSVTR